MRLTCGLALLLVSAPLGCGRDDKVTPIPAVPSASVTLDAGPEPWTKSNVCSRLPHEICSRRHECCEKTYIGFDQGVCEAQLKGTCESNLVEVEAGKMGFHPDEISTCLDSVGELWDRCNTLPSQLAEVYTAESSCRGIFTGTRAEGDLCARDDQCAQPAAASEAMVCSKQTGLCTRRWNATVHEPCSIEDENERPSCSPGLYCKVSFDPHVQATCEVAARDVIPCGMASGYPHCELGFRCLSNHQCVPALGLGAPCTNPSECASMACDGHCVVGRTPLTRAECGHP